MMDPIDLLSRSTADDEPSDDQDESLSLRDLPLTPPPHSSTPVDLHRPSPPKENHSRRSSSTSDFFFEFLVNHDDFAISPADDVIFCGRLLPYAPPPPRRSLSLSSDSLLLTQPKSQLTHHQSVIRPSRSLNYRKLRRNSCSKSEILPPDPSNSSRNGNPDHYRTVGSGTKPPWYWLAFGLPPKFPAEMELKDIKNRQFRRTISPVRSFTGERCSSSASWRLLNVLSCKSHASVDVRKTAPFRV